MRIKAELHIHSTLSACADTANTVNNLSNMSVLLNTQIVAISDHNACFNFPSFEEVCRNNGLLAVPAMEVTTEEEIHVLCLFRTYADAKVLCDDILADLPRFEVNTKFYNPQTVLDKEDNVVETIPYLLNVACKYDIYQLVEKVKLLGGIAIPAHVDRDSFSVISVLGEIPADLDVRCLEVSSHCPQSLKEQLQSKYNIIQSSDAHCLEDLTSNEFYLELDRISIKALFERLSK